MPLGPRQGYAVWPPSYTEDELTTAGLSRDGQHVSGWVKPPANKVWRPEELLWLPPFAASSTDLDEAGRIVDVTPGLDAESLAWVTAEINKRNRYLDALRDKVRRGALKLTAFLAKMLGLPFDEDGVQLTAWTAAPVGAAAAMKAAADLERMLRDTGRDEADDKHRYGLCACHTESGLPILPRTE